MYIYKHNILLHPFKCKPIVKHSYHNGIEHLDGRVRRFLSLGSIAICFVRGKASSSLNSNSLFFNLLRNKGKNKIGFSNPCR